MTRLFCRSSKLVWRKRELCVFRCVVSAAHFFIYIFMGECRMKTVFTESKRRTIPKRFEECVREDAVSSRLWSWCNILESLSTVLPIISIAVDMIAGYGNIIISGGVVSEESVSGANSEKITLFVQYVPILIAMLWKALLIYVSFHCAALLIGACMRSHPRIMRGIAKAHRERRTWLPHRSVRNPRKRILSSR